MRVCPKCKYVDHPAWKHTKYSYYIDNCSYENFKILYPQLAKLLTKKGSILEDEDYVYRRTCSKEGWVERKAKIDFVGNGWTDGTEAYPHIMKWAKTSEASTRWLKYHPCQTKLSEETNIKR